MATAGAPSRFAWTRSFLRSRKVVVGIAILVFFVLLGTIGPFFVTDPSATTSALLAPPSLHHLLGTTNTGQDVFAQIVDAVRVSFVVGLVAALIATAVAVAMGISSALLAGTWDEILSMLTNVFLVIPALPLVIVLAGYLHGAGTLAVAVVISVTAWPWTARILRAQTLSIRRRDFIQAARASGETTFRVICFEIVPNEVPLIAAQFLITVLYAILTQAGLAFLGVGSVTTWSWGTMLYWAENAQALSLGAWWWFVPPGLCLAILGTGLALLNFGIDEVANPQLRTQRRRRRRVHGGAAPMGTVPGIPSGPATASTQERRS